MLGLILPNFACKTATCVSNFYNAASRRLVSCSAAYSTLAGTNECVEHCKHGSLFRKLR